MTRYRLDGSTQRYGATVLGGSPLTLFRLSAAGADVIDRLAAGDAPPPGEAAGRLVDRLLEAGVIHPVPGPPPSTHTPADVTIVIPAHRVAPDDLARLVERCAGPERVVVVDDASDPPLSPVPGADRLVLDRNAGPAATRNAGLATVTTALVAFVDTDVEPATGWLDPLLGHFDDPLVALVAPRVASAPGPGAVARYETSHSPLDLGPDAARISPGTRVSYAPAAAVVVRVDALRSIGGFDETLRFGEDVDAVWRLVAAGWRCRYEPTSTVVHRPRRSWRELIAQRIGYGSSAAPLARRHPGALAPVRVSGWSAAVWGLVALGHPLAALAVAGGTAVALVRKLPDLPATVSLRLVAFGHLYAGRMFADALRRAWWPLLLVAAACSHRSRRVAVLAAMPALADGGPARLLDDVAYGIGLWRGVLAEREAGPLIAELRSWPGKPRR